MSSDEKRRAERLEHELLVAYRTVDGFITDWATNISKGGLFINSRTPLPVGTTVRLMISLPDAAFPFDLTGRVTRVVEPESGATPGMGVEFVDVDWEKKSRVERFVERLISELPEASASRPRK